MGGPSPVDHAGIVGEYPDLMARLDTVERELLRLASDDFAAKHLLLTERDALRTLIQEIHGDTVLTDDRPTEVIQREVAALRASAAAIRRQRIDLATQAGASNTVGDVNGPIGVNVRIDRATGYAALQQRIGQLESILDQRAET